MVAENVNYFEVKIMNENKELRAKKVQRKKADQNLNAIEEKYKSPKNWKHMYLRSEKLRRARQLGIDYPTRSNKQLLKDYS